MEERQWIYQNFRTKLIIKNKKIYNTSIPPLATVDDDYQNSLKEFVTQQMSAINALKVNNFSKKYKIWAEVVDQTKENK